MFTSTRCPDLDDYRQLISGRLAEAKAEELLGHLETCSTCAGKIQALPATDTLIEWIRQSKSSAPVPHEKQLNPLIQHLIQLGKSGGMLKFSCAGCNKPLRVKAEAAGKKVKCPHCGQVMAAPARPSETGQTSALAGMETVDLPSASSGAPKASTSAVTPTLATSGLSRKERELCSFLAPSQTPDELGRLGPYRVLKVLGAGGMGVVFRAEDPQLQRMVAIKAMLPGLAENEGLRQRFLREARLAASLKHDHVVTIHQVGEDRGAPFLAMEFLEGEALEDRLKREGKLPLAEVLRIGREIADGLQAAHERGLIHRDIKPGNIWLEKLPERGADAPRFRVKILDFGLARMNADDVHLTQSGAIVGTPAYMPPEQARGEKVDSRCDLYSLGCVLYRLCTGELPFKGDSAMSLLLALAIEQPKSPREINPDVPPPLADLILRLLAKDPAQRPATAAAVEKALQDIAVEKTADKTVELPSAIAPAPPRRRRKLLWAAAAGALFVTVLLTVIVIKLGGPEDGTVTVETVDPDVELVFTGGGHEYTIRDKKTGEEIKLPLGSYQVALKGGKDGLKLETSQFTLKRDGKEVVRVTWQAGEKSASTGDATKKPSSDNYLTFEGHALVAFRDLDWGYLPAFTIETYVRPDGTQNSLFVHRDNNAGFGWNGGRWDFNVRYKNQKKTEYVQDAGPPPPLGQWVHLAGVVDGKFMRFYVNGKRIGAKALGDELDTSLADHFYLGSAFVGALKNIRISKVARYQKEFTPPSHFEPDADTLALYRCNEGQGDVLKDSSGNGYHGKIVGAKWVKEEQRGQQPRQTQAAKRPAQVIDLISLFQDSDRISVKGFTEKNQWTKAAGKLTYTNDGHSGKIMVPVSLKEVRDYEIDAYVRRLSGNNVFTFDLLTLPKRQTGLDIFIGGRIELGLEGGQRGKIGAWPASVGDAGRIVTRVRFDADGRHGSVTVTIEGQLAAQWSGDLTAIGKPIEFHPDFPGEQVPGIFCYRDSFEFSSWQLRVYEGRAQVLPRRPSVVNEPPADWMPLFNGKDLAGWEKIGDGECTVENGIVRTVGTNRGWLATQKDYDDFELELEYRLAPKGNSGVFVHAWKEGDISGGQFLEVQLIDDESYDTVGKQNGTAAVFGTISPEPAVRSIPNTWHKLGIRSQGRFIRITFDGRQVIDANLDDYSANFERFPGLKRTTGRIGLQNFGSQVEFRNVRLRSLRPGQAPAEHGGIDAIDPAWVKRVAALPPKKQIEEVVAKLKERNPGFDGKVTHKLEDWEVTELSLSGDVLVDISAVRALPKLRALRVTEAPLSDLSPLKGMPLKVLEFWRTKVSDLSPLKGMPLTYLNCSENPVSNLSPLRAMPLTGLNLYCAKEVSDLSPLKGMPLELLIISSTKVFDLSPLKGMPLTRLECWGTQVSDLSPLKGMPLTFLDCNGVPVSDLSPLKDMKLTLLKGNDTKVSDLSPLKGMPLKEFWCDFKPERDAAILRSIKTLETINGKPAAQFWKEVDAKAAKK